MLENELSMNRKCEQSVNTDDRRTFTNVLGADKDKVPRDQTQGNDNKDAMLDCKSGFHQSEDKRNFHIDVTSVMIITFVVFSLKNKVHYQLLLLYLCHWFCRFCVYIIFACCAECLCGIKQRGVR